MIFGDHMAGLVLAGKKTQTRRPVHGKAWAPFYRPGHAYAIQRGRGLPSIGTRIAVIDVELQKLGDLTEQDAVAEGFKTRAEFLAHWHQLHPPTQIPPKAWQELAHLAACAPHPVLAADPPAMRGLERRGWAKRHRRHLHWELTKLGADIATTPAGPDLTTRVWAITFRVDEREQPLFLTPSTRGEHDGDEHGYTTVPGQAMPGELQALDPSQLVEIEQGARQRHAERTTDVRAASQARSVGHRLRKAILAAQRGGHDVTPHLAEAERLAIELEQLRSAA